jgi:hypothetical protein
MPVPASKLKLLSEHAVEIRTLGQRVAADVVEIGRRLTECKKLAGHGNWLPWLEREFGWSDETARKFMRAYEFARRHKFQQGWNMSNSALHLLAKPSTPEAARDEIMARAQAGERISKREVKDAAAQGRALAAIAMREQERKPTRVINVRFKRPEPSEPIKVVTFGMKSPRWRSHPTRIRRGTPTLSSRRSRASQLVSKATRWWPMRSR